MYIYIQKHTYFFLALSISPIHTPASKGLSTQLVLKYLILNKFKTAQPSNLLIFSLN